MAILFGVIVSPLSFTRLNVGVLMTRIVPVSYVEYQEGLGFAVLHQGKSAPTGNVIAGGNGSWLTADSESQSKINLVVVIDEEEVGIPVKWELKQVTNWQRITQKRAEKLESVYPAMALIYFDKENGYWRVSQDTMQEWATMLC